MKVLVRDRLVPGFPDYAPRSGWCQIKVSFWVTIQSINGLYFRRSSSPRVVVNYVREIGLRSTLQKVRSRSAERLRNQKYLSLGIGETGNGTDKHEQVMFIAPKHPRCVDHVVLPPEMVHSGEGFALRSSDTAGLAYSDWTTGAMRIPEWLQSIAGWDPDSGVSLGVINWDDVSKILRDARPDRVFPNDDGCRSGGSEEELPSVKSPNGGVTLFGYGNYAKTVILPALPVALKVERIHELDPLQVPLRRGSEIIWSTAPGLSPYDNSRAVFVAGYHHTHAPLAVEALMRHKDCVLEKPIAVSRTQVKAIEAALTSSRGRLWVCFQRRYSQLTDWAIEDLRLASGEPVNYHAIVFEVPLPAQHWYRWPNSRSRLVSNGCHWVDHFLLLNAWSKPANCHVDEASDGTVFFFLSLENGACMTMTLTDVGSGRIGVRDHVELRAGQVTIRIENDSDYIAEDEIRVVRRARVNKMSSYHRMYAQIGAAILGNGPGDTALSVMRSAETILELEEHLARLPRSTV